MRTHTKTTLQNLVFEVMNPENGVMKEEEICNWLTQLPIITEEVINTIRLIVFANLSDKLICRYYRQIQMECTLTLDRLHHYLTLPESMLPLYQHVLQCLEKIMEYMHCYYQKYLDPKVKMPILQYKKAAMKIESGIDVMVAAMMKCNIDKTLQALIVGKMARLLKDGPGSYSQLKSLSDLQGWIVELCKANVQVNYTSRLYTLLLRTNFNTSGFIAYSMAKIDRDLAEIYKVEEQYLFLYEREREFSRLTYKNGAMKFEPAC